MYPEETVQPMREELTSVGFREMRTAEEVDAVLAPAKGTVLVAVNSICGCAAGKARPGIALALSQHVRPDVLVTVFAGQDRDATAQARSYFQGHPPSSPQIALLHEGKVVFMLERHQIEGCTPEDIAQNLTNAFGRFCAPAELPAGS